MQPDSVQLQLPDWIVDAIEPGARYADDEARVGLAIRLAHRNVEHASGGPFGAAVFTGDGRLLAVGVNRVQPLNCSVAHAETMALMLAQARLGRPRLNAGGQRIILATSAQPCAMCYGACFWAGIDELLIGARAADVMRLTAFDEGPLPADWSGEFERRGVAVRRDLARDEACAVLAAWGETGAGRY
jgi:tRNA(Arg) A34 adenosine deaminase TadA